MDTSGSRGPFPRAVEETIVNNEHAEYLKIHPHTFKVSFGFYHGLLVLAKK